MHRATTMNITACLGYRNMPINHHQSNTNSDPDMLNGSNSETFFDNQNYRWIIKCLNGGYEVCTDLFEYMRDHQNLLLNFIRNLNAHSSKWRSRLNKRSSLSSYHTTKRAQIQTISVSKNLAQLIQTRCDAIQQVIAECRRQLDRIYPRERCGLVHKHYQSDRMEKKFAAAYSDLKKLSEKLQKLQKDKTNAEATLREAKIKHQNLQHDETISKRKLSEAKEHVKESQDKLQTIEAKITRTQDSYNHEQQIYREEATKIYQQCRVLEEERLNLIRETLIQFNQAVHSSQYSTDQDAIYAKVLLQIESEQRTVADLDFWAQTYHVDISTESIPPEINENDDENDDEYEDENTNESDNENEED